MATANCGIKPIKYRAVIRILNCTNQTEILQVFDQVDLNYPPTMFETLAFWVEIAPRYFFLSLISFLNQKKERERKVNLLIAVYLTATFEYIKSIKSKVENEGLLYKGGSHAIGLPKNSH